MIKVITGIRRCGKSYLLNNLFYHHLLESGVDADHIIRFAFDSADDLYLIGESLIQIEKEKRGVDPEKFMAYIRSKVVGEEKYYLLLDEIQMLDCFEAVLNGYLRKDNMDVFVTGSNAKLLSKDIATEFAGRGDEVHMYPLSFAEFMTIYSGDKYMGLSEYMLYGGIPLVVLREGANDKAVALQNLFNEIYLQDITKRNRVRNIEELEDLLNILSSAIGSLTNPEKLKNTFKTVKKSRITSATIKKYLDYFEDSLGDLGQIDFDQVKILFIGAGLNDYHSGTPIESTSDPYDEYTYCGAIRSIVKELREAYPEPRIIFITPPYTWYTDPELTCEEYDLGGGVLEDYVNAEIGLCEALNVEVIDIYHDYYPHDTWDDLYLYTDDGLHPNEAGREKRLYFANKDESTAGSHFVFEFMHILKRCKLVRNNG